MEALWRRCCAYLTLNAFALRRKKIIKFTKCKWARENRKTGKLVVVIKEGIVFGNLNDEVLLAAFNMEQDPMM